MLQSSPCTSPPIDCKIMGAGIDRLPFSGMPSELSYTTSVEACQIRIQRTKAPVSRRFFDILSDFSSVLRTCLHKKYMWIFEHNFVADKAKIRRRAVARQVFFTQDAAKFAEKARGYACEDGF